MKKLIVFLIMGITFNLFAQQNQIGKNVIIKSEFIYQADDVSFPSCHASTIVETSDGLVAAWFGGQYERHPEVGIWVSRFIDGDWTTPVEVVDGVQHSDLRYPTWNPVLFNYGDELFLFYKDGPNPRDWWGEYIVSKNNGKTWSKSCRLPEEIYGPIKNKPVLLENGNLLCPSSTEHDGWRVHMEMTPDRGKTWERTEALSSGEKFQAIQPAILKHGDGKLQILCRSKNQYTLSAWSADNGQTWTDLKPIELPNPNSGIDAVTLNDGKHALVYNHIFLKDNWSQRNVLNLAVSEDGINWDAAVLLEDESDKEAEFSYPAIIQTDDGLLHITYTWNRKLIKHVVVNPGKIEPVPVEDVWETK
jgi:predicted neuraminidase